MDKWQSGYMDTAERFASLSTAERLKVGSIVVKDNRIISIGYNGMPSGWTNTCEELTGSFDENANPITKTKPEVIHAEANAISKLAGSNDNGKDATMYITHAPCTECAKLIYGTGITRVFYKHKYRDENGIHFLEKCKIKVEQL